MPWGPCVKNKVITIDGPAGTGKSTVAKAVAKELGFLFLDTGALYRASALKINSEGVDLSDERALAHIISNTNFDLAREKTSVDGMDVTEGIRSNHIGMLASKIATSPLVRKELLKIQRSFALSSSLVAEGRDTGSVVFPDADVKIFLDALETERAKRRFLELINKKESVTFDEVLKDIQQRDIRDKTREVAPLVIPENAVVVDTTHLNEKAVVSKILEIIKERLSDQ